MQQIENKELNLSSNLENLTEEILNLKNNMAKNVILLGEKLKKVKENLSHGDWINYLDEKIDFTPRTAQKFIKIATEYGNTKSLSYLGTEKLYTLISLPKNEREKFLKNNDVEKISTRELKKMIKEKKESKTKTKKETKETFKKSIEHHQKLLEEIKINEQNIKNIKEEMLKNTTNINMSVRFQEVYDCGILKNDLGYNIFFTKNGVEDIICQDYLAHIFCKIDVTDEDDLFIYEIRKNTTLIQDEEDFILGECLKFVETAKKRLKEYKIEKRQKEDEKIKQLLNGKNENPDKEILKKFYITLAKKYHPDCGGSQEEMKILNELKENWDI